MYEAEYCNIDLQIIKEGNKFCFQRHYITLQVNYILFSGKLIKSEKTIKTETHSVIN